jgi:hypothetical protein
MFKGDLFGFFSIYVTASHLKGAQACEFFARFFALQEPTWVGDLGTDPKKHFFII